MTTTTKPLTVAKMLGMYRTHNPAAESTDIYRGRFFTRLVALIGNRPAAEVRPIDVLEFANTHTTWSPGTRRLAVSAISAAFAWAAKVGVLDRNPLVGLSMPPTESGRAWTEEEYLRAVEATKHFRRFLQFLRHTGARPGEASAMRWADVKKDHVLLQDHKTRGTSGRPRVIPLDEAARMIVTAAFTESTPQESHVFTTRQGRPWDRAKLSHKMDLVRAAAKLPKDCVLHGIRHLFATDFVKRGGNIAVLSKILGHASITTTIACYVHLADDDVPLMLDAIKGLATTRPLVEAKEPT